MLPVLISLQIHNIIPVRFVKNVPEWDVHLIVYLVRNISLVTNLVAVCLLMEIKRYESHIRIRITW